MQLSRSLANYIQHTNLIQYSMELQYHSLPPTITDQNALSYCL